MELIIILIFIVVRHFEYAKYFPHILVNKKLFFSFARNAI